MSSKIIKTEGNKITLQVEVELDAHSMLNSEEQILQALNGAGMELTKAALSQFDTDGSPLSVEGEKYTSRGQEKKSMKRRGDQ
jgi:hypothetical protein